MPNLNTLSDFVTNNIGSFEKGKWDYIGLAQLYPQLECLAQLVPRKVTQDNYESTIVYQTRTETSGHGAKAGDPVQPVNRKKSIRRKVKMVKWVDSIGWTLDQGSLQGKSDEHINEQVQMDLVDFDLHWWQDLEHMLLKMPADIDPEDDDDMFGFPAWLTAAVSYTGVDDFQLNGGADPYGGGRPGNISVAQQPGYTNPAAKFSTISDESFFEMFEKFLLQRKLMGAVPNPRLLADTPNDVCYVQLKVHNAITRYLNASNENVGMDAGHYRGNPTYKGIPISLWHALGHVDSPVAPTTCQGYIVDWNSIKYGVQPGFDRKIEGPKDVPGVPSSKYVTSEVWHQLTCDRPDRNLFFESATASLQP